jgi:hypothetical protein
MAERLTAFRDDRIVARGDRGEVVRALVGALPADGGSLRVFDDETGRPVDLDFRTAAAAGPPPQRARGRPRLGVVAREVTLLPRQWEWLGRQPGGASAALRRLVEAARGEAPSPAARRDAAYHFLTDLGGDRPGYEEAIRALYRGDTERLFGLLAGWPGHLADYARELLGEGADEPRTAAGNGARAGGVDPA